MCAKVRKKEIRIFSLPGDYTNVVLNLLTLVPNYFERA
jgi:hypothetical protein